MGRPLENAGGSIVVVVREWFVHQATEAIRCRGCLLMDRHQLAFPNGLSISDHTSLIGSVTTSAREYSLLGLNNAPSCKPERAMVERVYTTQVQVRHPLPTYRYSMELGAVG